MKARTPVEVEVLVILSILRPAHAFILEAFYAAIGRALVKPISHALHIRVTVQVLKRVLPCVCKFV